MDKVFTNIEHAAWLREQAKLKRPYWYGTCFQKCSEALLQAKKKQYKDHYHANRMARYRQDIAAGQICGDCVNGAIKGAIWTELGTRALVYTSHGCPDLSADSMFAYCKRLGMDWGPINTMPDEIGLAVRMKGHVGVYVGNGEVVEWRGFAHGCVVTKLKSRNWLHWYRLPWTEYVEGDAEAPETAQDATTGAHPTLRKGMEGDAVEGLQRALVACGYFLPKYGPDGDFGQETLDAVKAFQEDHSLEVDGVVGSKTWRILDGSVASRAVIRKGQEGDQVEALQRLLAASGHTLEPDGDFGSKTQKAVKDFQKAMGLEVDGIVGSKTWAALIAARS